MTAQEEARAALNGLHPRKREVIVLLAQGHSKKSAARIMGIAEETVITHAFRAYRTLGIKKAAQAAILCCLAGEINDWRTA